MLSYVQLRWWGGYSDSSQTWLSSIASPAHYRCHIFWAMMSEGHCWDRENFSSTHLSGSLLSVQALTRPSPDWFQCSSARRWNCLHPLDCGAAVSYYLKPTHPNIFYSMLGSESPLHMLAIEIASTQTWRREHRKGHCQMMLGWWFVDTNDVQAINIHALPFNLRIFGRSTA